jgi:autotransporter-associated beta strand protein
MAWKFRWLDRFLKSPAPAVDSRKKRVRKERRSPSFDALERRELPATISGTTVLTYAAGAGIDNNLTVAISGANFVFTDTAETITTSIAGATNSGTNSVSVPTASVTGITLNLGDGNDTIGTAGVVLTTQALIISNTGTSLNLSGPLTTTTGSISVTNSGTGDITETGAITSTSGNVSVSSSNGYALNASINAGSGTISLLANQDSVGADSFTQNATAATSAITTTNTSASAVTIQVNTNTGGTGNANIRTITASSGTLTIQAFGGSILYAGTDTLDVQQSATSTLAAGINGPVASGTGQGGSGQAPTGNISAKTYAFSTSTTGSSSIGTAARPIQSNSGASNAVTLTTGSGGAYFVDWGNALTLSGATATGAGNVVVVSANAGSHNLAVTGNVSTGSGNIVLAADDNLTIATAATIGGAGFSGSVYLAANRDTGNTATLTASGTITTTSTSATAVVIEGFHASNNGTNAGVTTVNNITVGNGGTITVSTVPASLSTGQGAIAASSTSSVLNAGANGTVKFIATSIVAPSTATNVVVGTAAIPMKVTAGNVIVTALVGTSGSLATQGDAVFVTDTIGGNFTATTGNANPSGAITLTTATGALTINGATSTGNSNAITLNGNGGVVVNATLGNATAGAIGITGALSGAGNIVTGAGALTVTQTTNSSYSGVISGSQNVTKAGTGNLTLAGNNTFTGATAVTAGTLTVNGQLNGTSGVNVSGGAFLAGSSGAITSAATTTITGTLTPGNGAGSAGVLNTGNLAFGGGTYAVTLNGVAAASTAYDQVNVTGTVDLTNSTLALESLTAANLNAGVPLLIIKNDGVDPVVSTFAGQVEGSTIALGGVNFTVSYLGGDGNDVTLTRQSGTTFTVDPSFNASTPGFGTTAFATIGSAIATATAAPDAVISVNAGTYNEAVVIDRQLTLSINGAVNIGSLADTVTNAAVVLNTGATLTTGSDNSSTAFGSVIAGPGSLVKTGSGAFTLNNASNSYTGGTTVSTGRLVGGSAGAIPNNNTFASDTTVTVSGGATLALNGNSVRIGTLSGAGNVENGAATPGTLLLGGSNGTFAFSGLLRDGTGGGALNVTKIGTGVVSLGDAANSYTGVTTVSGGILAVDTLASGGAISDIGASTNAAGNLVLAGGTLRYTAIGATTSIDRSFTLGTGGGTIDVADPATVLTITGDITGSSSTPFTKVGSGKLVFSDNLAFGSANTPTTYGSINTGTITVSAGELQVANLRLNNGTTRTGGIRNLSIATGAVVTSTGTLFLDPKDYTTPIIAGPGTLKLRTASASSANPSIAWDVGPNGGDAAPFGTDITAPIDVGSTGTQVIVAKADRNDVGRYSGDLRFDGSLSGAANLQFIGLSQNTAHNAHFVFNADNTTFTGGVFLANADLALTATNALTAANSFTFDSAVDANTTNRASLLLFGHNMTIGSLNDTSAAGTTSFIRNGALVAANGGTDTTGGGGAIPLGSNTTATLTITQTTPGTFAGAFQDGPNDTGAGATGTYNSLLVVKAGTATLTLTGSSTLTGSITVNAGTLANNGAIGGSSGVTVNNNATLGGTGSTAIPVSVATGGIVSGGTGLGAVAVTGTIAPAGSTGGVINTGNLTFGTGGVYQVQALGVLAGAGASGYDQINVTGTVDLSNSTLSITGVGANTVTPQTPLVIINNDASDPITNTFAGLPEGATVTAGGVNFTISYLGGDGNDVTLTRQPSGTFYVDASWAGFAPNTNIADADPVAPGNQPAVFGTTAFASVNAALAVMPTFANLVVNQGTYHEAVVISTPVTMNLQSGPISFDSLADAATPVTSSLNLNGIPFTVGGNNSSTSYSGTVTGAGSLTKVGTGTFTLAGSNGYTGGTTVSAGTLAAGAAGAFGVSTPTSVASGAKLEFAGFNQSIGDLIGAGIVDSNGSTAATLTITNTVNSLFSGDITQTGSGAFGVTKGGNFTETLAGTGTYSGATTINAGTLKAGSTTAFSPTSAFTLAANGTLALNGFNEAIGSLSGTGTVTNGATGNAALTLGGDGTSTTFTGLFQNGGAGALSVVKTGAGTFQPDAAETYTGGTTISQGTVLTNNAAGLGTGTVTLGDTNTGTSNVAFLTSTNGLTFTNNFVVSASGTGTATIGTSAGITGAVNTQWNGSLTLNRDVILQAGSSDRTTFTGQITGTGNIAITATSAGNRVNFARGAAPANNFAGNVTIGAGAVLQLGVASTIGNNDLPDTTSITFTDAASELRLTPAAAADSEFMNALVSGVPGAGMVTKTTGTGTFTLTVGAGNGSGSFSGVLSNATGTLALVKDGTGTQTLAGASTYTGNTTVSGGTLLVNNTTGSGLGTGAVTVGPLATLGGTGTISGPVTVNGALLPGGVGATSVLATGNVAFGTSSILAVDLNGTTVSTQYDQVNVTGTVNLTGSSLQILAGAGLAVGNTFTIINNDLADAVTGNFSNATTLQAVNNPQVTFTVSTTGGDGNDVVVTVASIGTGPKLDFTGGVITLNAASGASDGVTVTNTAGVYTITDSAAAIGLSAAATAAGWIVNGNGSVTGPSPVVPVSGIVLNLGDGADQIAGVAAGSANLTIGGSGTLTLSGPIATTGNVAIGGFSSVAVQNTVSATAIAVNSPGAITATAAGKLIAPTLTLNAAGGIGTSASNLKTQTTTATTASSGPTFITEDDGATFTSTTTGLNDLDLANLAGSLTVTASTVDGNIAVTDQGTGLTLTANAGGLGNLTATTAGTLTVAGASSTGAGNLSLTGATGVTGNAAVSSISGNVSIVSTSGTLAAGAITTTTGNVTLSSGGAVTLGGNLNAGSGLITITADTLGTIAAVTAAFDQKAATITTTNTSQNALTIAVNTPTGGAGDAIIGQGSVGSNSGGTVTVTSNGGSILWSNDPSYTTFTGAQTGLANGGSNTQVLKANNYVFTATGAAGSVGTDVRPLQTDSYAANDSKAGAANLTMSAGSGGIFITDWGANGNNDISVHQATATGAGKIRVVAANAGGHDLFIDGPVTTGSGAVQLYADDDLILTANAQIGGAGFSGTVDLEGDRDNANGQFIYMAAGSTIVTSNSSSGAATPAVQILGFQAAGGSDNTVPTDIAGGGIEVANIKVGTGGTILLNAVANASGQGSIVQQPGTLLDAGTTGSVILIAKAVDALGSSNTTANFGLGNIGIGGSVSAPTPLPITTNAGTISATTVGTTLPSTGNILINATASASFSAVTTGSANSTIALSTTAGILTASGPINSDGGAITLTSTSATGGVAITSPLSDANSGDITINAGTNAATLATTLTLNATQALNVTAANGLVVTSTGVLAGAGKTGNAPPVSVASGGTISPGGIGTVNTLNVGNIAAGTGANLRFDLNGNISSDALSVTGTVDVTGSNLVLMINQPLTVGTSFTLVSNDGTDAVVGTFVGNTTVIGFNDPRYTFSLNYAGGDGNDIVATVTSFNPVSIFDVTNGVGTYLDKTGSNSVISATRTASAYSFTNTAVAIQLTTNAINAGWTGTGTNTVTGPVASVSSFVLNMADGTDSMGGFDAGTAPLAVTGTGSLNVTGIVSTSSTITVSGVTDISMALTGASLQGTTLTLTASNSIGAASQPVDTAATTIVASAGAGGMNIAEADGANVTASATGVGNIIVSNALGTLTVAGTTSTVTGNLSISSADGLVIAADVNSGTGNLVLAANTDGAGATGLSQTAGTITSGAAGASAATITANTASGGTGDISIDNTTITGTLTVKSNNGNILYAGTTALTGSQQGIISGGSAPTRVLVAGSYVFTATGPGSIGTDQRPMQSSVPATNSVLLSAGDGGAYWTDWTNPMTLAGATATGPGNVRVVSANAGGHDLSVTGPVNTGSGSIYLAADDNLTITAPIGSASFSGTVYLAGNRDLGNTLNLRMNAGASITTSNNTASAVLLEGFSTNGTAAGGITLNNITVGDGGTITATTVPTSQPASNGDIAGFSSSVVLNAGPTGQVVLVSHPYPVSTNAIGSSTSPILVTAGTVNVTVTVNPPTAPATTATNGGVYIVGTGPTSFVAVTSGFSPNNSSMNLSTLTGALTINGATNSANGEAINLNGAGGVVLAAALGSSTTGPLSITGALTGTGNIITGTAGVTLTQNTNSTYSAVISGTGGLVKAGIGTLTLSNTSTFAGPTTVSAGDLAVSGSLSGTSGTTVGATGTLTGTGTITPLNIAGVATAADLGTTGTLNTGNLSFTAGGVLAADITSLTGFDQISVVGSVDMTNAGVRITVPASGLHLNDQFILIANDGTDPVVGLTTPLTVTSANNPLYTFTISVGGDGNDVVATLSAIAVSGTLDVTNGVVSYGAGAGVNNNLNVNITGGNYVISDAANPVTLTSAAISAGWSVTAGVATGPSAGVTSLVFNLNDGTDAFSSLVAGPPTVSIFGVGSLALNGPVTANGSLTISQFGNVSGVGPINTGSVSIIGANNSPLTLGALSVVGGNVTVTDNNTVTFSGAVSAPLSTVTLTGAGNIVASAAGSIAATTLTLGSANGIGASATPLGTQASAIIANAGAGGVFIAEVDGADVTATSTGAGNIAITNGTGTLNIAGTTSAVLGNISLSSGDAITLGANVVTGSGTITIAANTDGTGTQGYDQQAASIITGNTTANAVSITVNTAVGGTGNAVIGLGSVGGGSGGTINVNSNAGSILWTNDPSFAAFSPSQIGTAGGGTNTQTLNARDYIFKATGAGAIGDPLRPIQTNDFAAFDEASGGGTVTLTAGTGGIYLVDWGAPDLTVNSAIAQGAGGIRLVAANATASNLWVAGPVSTGSGSISLYSDDELTIDAGVTIGGAGFSGTVDVQANRDAGNNQSVNMMTGSSIQTSNATATAVSIQAYSSDGSLGLNADLPVGGVELGNITTGSGGTITVLAGAGTAANKQGSIIQRPNTVLDVGTGSVVLTAIASSSATAGTNNGGDIGVGGSATTPALWPIVVHAGSVTATANGTTLGNTGNIDILGTAATSMAASTTGSAASTVTLATQAGVLTISGPTNTDGGAITATGAGGVTIANGLNDANTGNIAINAGTNPATLTGTLALNTGQTLSVTAAGGLGIAGSGVLAGTDAATNTFPFATQAGGSVSPGTSTAVLTTGNANLAGGVFVVNLNGAAVGSGYDQLNVTGTVTLTGATLSATLGAGFTPTLGTSFTIINNDASDAVVGTFAGLPEGSVTVIGGINFKVSYVGGDGNDVTLTVTNLVPSSTAISSSANPSNFGTSATITATVTGASPTGNVLFTVDGVAQTPVPLTGNTAQINLSPTLAGGPHTVTALYTGDTANGTSLSSTLTQTVNAPSTPDHLVFVTGPQSLTAGVTSGTITIQLLDVSNNPFAATSSVVVSLTTNSTGGQFLDAATGSTTITSVTINVGSSTATFKYSDTLAGTAVVTLTDNALPVPSATQSETVAAGAAASVTVTSGSGQSATVNTVFTNPLVATVKDSFGNLVSGVTVTFAAPTTGAGATLGSPVTVTTGANGQASDTIIANTVSGTYSVTASAAGVAALASFSETNLAGAARSIAVTSGAGQSATVNTAFANPVVATVKDTFGNPISGVAVTFAAPTSSASAVVGSPFTVTTGANGQASDTIAANTVAGTYNVTVTAPGVAAGASFTETNLVGAASSIAVVSGSGQSATVNTSFANPLVATVTDSFGNPISGVAVTFTAPTNGASASLGSAVTVTTGSNGQASESITANTVAGAYTVTATASSIGATASFAETNVAGPASSIAVVTGSGQSATVNTTFTNSLVATITDGFGNPVSGVAVTFTAPTNGASASVGSLITVTTGSNGQASDTITANTIAGGYSVTATAAGVGVSASFAETNLAGAAASISVTSGAGQSATVNTGFANPLVATVKDTFGNPVTGVAVTFAAPTVGASGVLGIPFTATTGASGQASDTITANTVAGSYSVTATATGVGTAASVAETNLAGAATSVSVTAGGGQSATVNTAFANALVATVTDSFGNPVSGVAVTFAAPTSSASAALANPITVTTGVNGQASDTITANTAAGAYNVTATASGVATPASFAEINLAGAATSIAATSGAGQTTSLNTAFASALVVTVTDSFGNPVSGVAVTFTAPTTGASGTLASPITVTTGANGQASDTITANNVLGGYTVSATAASIGAATFSETNAPAVPANVVITSGDHQAATVNTAFAHPLVVTVTDGVGNPISGVSVTFAAPSSGPGAILIGGFTVTTGANGQATDWIAANANTGTYAVTATVTGVATSASFSETNNISGPSAVTHFGITAPSTAITGVPFAITVTALDANNNPVTSYTGTIDFAKTDNGSGVVIPGSYTFQPGDNGSKTFTPGVTFTTTSNQVLFVTDHANSAITGTAVIGMRGLTVTGGHVTATPTGFSAGFSKPYVPATLNLYDASTSNFGGADVTLFKGQLIGSITETGTTVTVTTSVAHTLTAANIGQTVTIAGISTSGYNGVFTITGVPSTTTFTYTATASGLSTVASSGIYFTNSTLEKVSGSLLLDSSNSTITFLKTETRTTTFLLNGVPQGSLLSAGTYQATFASGTSGFVDGSGETLDGNSDGINGDNFTDTFVVGTPPVAVTLPDFSRGPSDSVTPNITSITETGTIATVTTVVPHDFQAGNPVTIAGFTGAASAYNTAPTATILAVLSPTTFTYDTGVAGLTTSTGNSGTTATSAAIINVPNTLAQGIPIGLTNGSGATSGSMTLSYDATLLNITGAVPNPTLVTNNGLAFTSVTFAGSGASSTVTIAFTATTALPSTILRLGGLTASVPTTAPYKSKDLLHWTNVALSGNSGPITAVGSDALHVVAYFGDADASGAPNTAATYTGNDVTLAGRVGTGADSGLAAFRLVDPVIVADVSSDGRVNTNDGSTLNAQIGAPQQAIPLKPSLTGITTAGPDPTISIPKNLPVTAGGTVTVPVMIDDPRPSGSTGMTQAILALRYDPGVFTVSASDIALGSVPASSKGWKLNASVDPATGQIGAILYAAGGVPIASAAAGSLITVKLHAKAGAVNGSTPLNLAAEVTVPGLGVVRTQIDDDQGAYVLTPAPTDAANDLVDGSVIVSGGVVPSSTNKTVNSSAVAAAFRQPTTSSSQPLVAPVALAASRPTLWSTPAAGGGVPDNVLAKMLAKPAPADLAAIAEALAQGSDEPVLPKVTRGTVRRS